MPHFIRTQVVWKRASGDPADDQTNTFYHDGDDVSFAGWADAAQAAVNDIASGYAHIREYVHSTLFTGEVIYNQYDMEDPEPRVPKRTESRTLAPLGEGPHPLEMSMVLSFQAERESGINQARRRGRVYLPTFGQRIGGAGNIVLTAAGARVSFTSAVITDGAACLNEWINNPTIGLRQAVFSPTSLAEGVSLADSFNDITNGWVDDEPDTQRRRGGNGGTRTTVT